MHSKIHCFSRTTSLALSLLLAAPAATVHAIPTASAAAGGLGLEPGETLKSGQSIRSPNGDYSLYMQGDGNFVLYGPKGALWAAGTEGKGNVAVMQADGNLVVYSADKSPLWYSGTWDDHGARLRLQNDGNLVLYRGDDAVWHTNTYVRDTSLVPGEKLVAGQQIVSPDDRYALVMQKDGNLVLYSRSGPRWASNTPGAGNYAVMQKDGNLVIYDGGGKARWSTGTYGHSGAQLVLQTDGNLVLYKGKAALWNTKTGELPLLFKAGELLRAGQQRFSSNGKHRLVMQGDGNLVLYGPSGALWSSQTQGAGNYAAMQADGNLVVYSVKGQPKWATGTDGHPDTLAKIDDDGELLLLRGGQTLWRSRKEPSEPGPSSGGIVWAYGPNGCQIQVHASIKANVEALLQAANAAGRPMCGWGWRSPEQQIQLRKKHCGISSYAIWEMPASKCSPPTARPGQSKHESGLAIDFYNGSPGNQSDFGGGQLSWMLANAGNFGLHNLPSESWHWSVDGH